MCECVYTQTFVAFLLVANFAVNIAESEILDLSVETKQTFQVIDNAFTLFYVLELLANAFVNGFWSFVTNGWSVFDTIAVALSVLDALLQAVISGPSKVDSLSFIRSVRMYVALFVLLSHYSNNDKDKIMPLFFHNRVYDKHLLFTSLANWIKMSRWKFDIKFLSTNGRKNLNH